MKAASITIDTRGRCRCLYTEAIPLQSLGRISVVRATTIEFDSEAQEWEVRNGNQELLFRSASRQRCLDWEREHLG